MTGHIYTDRVDRIAGLLMLGADAVEVVEHINAQRSGVIYYQASGEGKLLIGVVIGPG